MSLERRTGGLPLAVYVIALLLIPLVGVGFFGMREIDHNDRASDAAGAVSGAADVYVTAAAVLAPLEFDRMASLGLARIDDLGLDRELVIDLLGVDYEALAAGNDVVLDRSLDALEAALATHPLGSFGGMIALHRAELESVRSSIGTPGSTLEVVDAVYDDAVHAVGDVLAAAENEMLRAETDASEAADLVRRLQIIVQVVTTAQDEAETFASVAFGDGATSSGEMLADGLRHSDALGAAEMAALDGTSALTEAYVALPDMPRWMFTDDDEYDGGRALNADVQSVGSAVVAHLDYLALVSEFAAEHGAELCEGIGSWAEGVRDRTQTTLILFVIIGSATLLFGTIVLRSFAHPLQKLRAQAERISRGELSADPLVLAGPSDVRKVTSAINEMASTLSLVEVHMDALAVAENGVGPDLRELPGHVGASMRTSMERVTALTTRLQMSEARLAEEARVDNLTGLPNRFAVLEILERVVRDPVRGERMTGVMFVDIDGFKSVNDTHGHAVGDVVLREIAQRLSGSVREIDVVARLGGDEFLIVVGDMADQAQLLSFGQRVIEEIEHPYQVGEQLFGVSASIGATLIEPGDHSMSAVERADAAVYQAKRRGRRRVEMFDKELQASIEHQAELELALRQAIQHGELRIYLQPLADMTTGRAAGAEALVRWERPGVGLVPPGDFIPVAERSGLIFDVERWVLEAACRRVAEWRLAGRGDGMRLAVNISGRHLIEGSLLADLDDAIAATGADPNLLEIELTESHLLDDVGRANEVLASVRSRGIKVAIDDFGTGYSSMTYLQKLPVDVVKIDRSFIATATANKFDSTIVESVVTIGRALSLDIVAEGIETFDQLAYAMAAGVTLGQGFLLARPMPAEDAEAVMFGPALFDAERVRSEAGLDRRAWTQTPPQGERVELVD